MSNGTLIDDRRSGKEFILYIDANDETEAISVKNVLEKKLKELQGDNQKDLLAQMTQLVEGHSTVVEMRAPVIQTEIHGHPPGSRTLPKSITKRGLSKFEHL
uniref:AlNc14C162G7789 protein n=1 Tax=Albugo laibachii Nc14 TaxID=890382 RepID=F0WMV3_9STRA|nr:AlNc14C162G7789 [Albugo laibachii Nc14]|eukprot:CCA22638.1 AlNc14C162G7789 [Albugo laibachii Nc14]